MLSQDQIAFYHEQVYLGVENVPVLMPEPPAKRGSSIYEIRTILKERLMAKKN